MRTRVPPSPFKPTIASMAEVQAMMDTVPTPVCSQSKQCKTKESHYQVDITLLRNRNDLRGR